MAGEKQHDLPRFLFRGFASRNDGKKAFTWQFRKDARPVEVSIADIGHSKFFYNKPGPNTLDALITDKESEYGQVVARLRREHTLRSSSDKETLIEFVHNLVLRTRNLRDTLVTSFNSMLNELYSVATDPGAIRRQLLKERKANSEIWKEALKSYVKKTHGILPRQQRRYRERKESKEIKQWLQHGAEAHAQKEAARHKIQLTPLLGQVGEIAKTTHNDALRKVLEADSKDDPTPRYNHYHQLHWRVQSLESKALILGDAAVLQFEQRRRKFSMAFDSINKGDVILLPLSHDLLIIGSPEDFGPLPSPHEINCASAKLSFHFFVASENSERERTYQTLLGQGTVRVPKILVP
jgi:hypothetical protein